MKKILLTIFLLCCLTTATNLWAQPCTPYEGLKVVILHYDINSFGQQATEVPTLSNEGTTYLTNHIITWNETTGNLEAQSAGDNEVLLRIRRQTARSGERSGTSPD